MAYLYDPTDILLCLIVVGPVLWWIFGPPDHPLNP